MEMAIFWDLAPCSLVDIDHQGDEDDSHPDDGCSKILLNVSQYLPDYMMQHPQRQPSLCVITSQHTNNRKYITFCYYLMELK
jgi:hypothetical protein